MDKKYAIVRVDNLDICPSALNEIKKDFICELSCRDCRYGDTKEQLISKVAQVIKRELKGDCIAGLKDTVFVMEWCGVEKLAKQIIEFLGVK